MTATHPLMQDALHDVFQAELEEINQRKILTKDGRVLRRGEKDLLDFDEVLVARSERSDVFNQVLDELQSQDNRAAWEQDTTVAHKGLVGLAFSGGGIRSATVNLGVIQALRNLGLLKCVDYVSTVSGGGYIGSCYSAVNTSLAEQHHGDSSQASDLDKAHAHDDLFRHKPGVAENPVFRHLRNNANYMAPNGLIDVLRVPSVFLRGMAINFFVVLPYVMLFAVLSALILSSSFQPQAALENVLESVGLSIGQSFIFTKTLLLLTLLVYLLSPIAYMLVNRSEGNRKNENTWQLRNVSTRFLGWCIASIFIALIVEFQPIAIHFYANRHYLSVQEMAIYGGAGSATLSVFATKLLPKLSGLLSKLGVYILGFIGIAVFWVLYLDLSNRLLQVGTSTISGFVWRSPLGFSIIAGSLILFASVTGDANFTSISRFYRDRLSKAYIFGFNEKNELQQKDTLKLSDLDTSFTPYHLLNVTLNLSKTSQAYSADRRGDFFFFSKRYVGSVSTGYCKTEALEAVNSDLNLATAMAISAAAAAPNLGKDTIKPLVFVLGMLNIRYDYWLLNPRWVNQGKGKNGRAGPGYFLRELASDLSADSQYVNLSDGGHIENLGMYELIRRECRLIIAGDSEADLNLTYPSLSALIRLVQIDFGVIIVMDGLDAIRDGKQHYAIGTIYYRNNKVGKLIYLKSSLLGDYTLQDTLAPAEYETSKERSDDFRFDKNPYLANYKTTEPTFPHQSSANQFYDETQFECYRALGYQMATTSLAKKWVKQEDQNHTQTQAQAH